MEVLINIHDRLFGSIFQNIDDWLRLSGDGPITLTQICQKHTNLVHLTFTSTRNHARSNRWAWDLRCLGSLRNLRVLDLDIEVCINDPLQTLFRLCNEAFPLDDDGADNLSLFPDMKQCQVAMRDYASYHLGRTSLGQVKRWICKHRTNPFLMGMVHSPSGTTKSMEIKPCHIKDNDLPIMSLSSL